MQTLPQDSHLRHSFATYPFRALIDPVKKDPLHPLENKITEIEARLMVESHHIPLAGPHLPTLLSDPERSIPTPDGHDKNKKYLTLCAAECVIDGLWMEFGVHRGRTISHIAAATDQMVYGFDSFEGLPEAWTDGFPKGLFSLNGEIPEGYLASNHSPLQADTSPITFKENSHDRSIKPWPKNITLIKGWFDDSLPSFVTSPEGDKNVAFLHIDCDLYSSTKTIFKYLGEKIVAGTIICFDEIYGYTDYRQHEIKAFAEFLLEFGHEYEPLYLVPGRGQTQGSFKILDQGKK